MDTLRFGIVGFGTQGRTYCHLLSGTSPVPGGPAPKKLEGCTLGAVCTSSPEKRAAIEQTFPGVAVFTDYGEMLRSGTCDAILPTVPHYEHHGYAIGALEAGLHVLSEKPLTIRASDGQKVLDCAAAHPEQTLGILLNQRANRLYQKIRDIVKSGELGQVRRSVWIINNWWRPDAYYRQNDWRGTWGGEGGGVLVNQAPHQLDLWQWICGVPRSVTSVNLNGCHRDISAENDVTMVTRYENGATGVFITCTHDPIGTDRLEINLDGGKILVENSRKATVYRMVKDGKVIDEDYLNRNISMQELATLTSSNGSGGLFETEVFESSDGWGVQHGRILQNFADHVRKGTPLLAPGEDGMLGVRLANASQLSAWLGQTVKLPCDEALYNAELNKRIAEEGKYPLRD